MNGTMGLFRPSVVIPTLLAPAVSRYSMRLVGGFILGMTGSSFAGIFGAAWARWAMWTIGVAVRWAANVGLMLLTIGCTIRVSSEGSRISGICQLGVVRIAGLGSARIGGDHGLRHEYFWYVHSRAELLAETALGRGDKLGTFIRLF